MVAPSYLRVTPGLRRPADLGLSLRVLVFPFHPITQAGCASALGKYAPGSSMMGAPRSVCQPTRELNQGLLRRIARHDSEHDGLCEVASLRLNTLHVS